MTVNTNTNLHEVLQLLINKQSFSVLYKLLWKGSRDKQQNIKISFEGQRTKKKNFEFVDILLYSFAFQFLQFPTRPWFQKVIWLLAMWKIFLIIYQGKTTIFIFIGTKSSLFLFHFQSRTRSWYIFITFFYSFIECACWHSITFRQVTHLSYCY